MRTLVWLPAVSAAALTACFDNAHNVSDVALITTDWNFKDLATNTVINDCPQGFDTTAVTAHRLDADSPDIVDLYDCVAGTGTPLDVNGYDPGVYEVFFQITSHGGGQLYAESLHQDVDVTVNDASISDTILNDGGYFAFKWELRNANNAPISCATANAKDVTIDAASGGMMFSRTFGCNADFTSLDTGAGGLGPCIIGDDNQARACSNGLLAGNYTVSFSAQNAAGTDVGKVTSTSTNSIGDQNQVTNLNTIQIPITN